MEKQQEIIVVMDMGSEAVRVWFERLKSQARHPQYQGKIRVVGPVETK